ncbi:MAG: NAD-dependent epimerase/dehydratase family protein [Bryobacteraceae bacterium]|nr:NAD-dependent epimerase/dehydratase family protein [Bryobacteraceae bacterium]
MKPVRSWLNKTVLVTGASGLVGGWLVRELLESGAEVVALVRDVLPGSFLVTEGLVKAVTVVNGSITDLNLLRRAVSEYEPDTVFHLAAQTLVGAAKKDPLSTLETNVRGTWNVLEACRLVGVGQVVVASSDKAYGSNESLPYRETHPLQGKYPYDCSKSCTDLICTMYAETYNQRIGIARCGNIFGGGDLNFSRVLPDLIRSTLRGERLVIRSDGQFVRDFLYVRDAAGAYMWLAEKLASDKNLSGQAFNFSLETRFTVLEIVSKVLGMMNRQDLEPVIQNVASSEIREQYMACDKARGLGWNASYSFEDGLRETIQWYTDYLRARNETAREKAASGVV